MLWYIHLSEENRLVRTTRKNHRRDLESRSWTPPTAPTTVSQKDAAGPDSTLRQRIVAYDGALVKSVVGITRQDRRRAPPRPRPCIPGAGIRESAMDGAGQPLLVHRGGGN